MAASLAQFGVEACFVTWVPGSRERAGSVISELMPYVDVLIAITLRESFFAAASFLE